jgi:pantetheine-phosphate adenylyltransferase
VILAVAKHTNKESLFSLEERRLLCEKAVDGMKGVRVIAFEGLVVDFAREMNSTVMIRGMRAVSDFEYELQIALMNKKLCQDIETIFMVPSFRYLYLSSSMMRQLAELKADLTDFVPRHVQEALHAKYR